MPSKRAIVDVLTRVEMQALATHFNLNVEDRRSKSQLVEALAGSRSVGIADMLGQLAVTRLRALCEEFMLTPTGRTKAASIEALMATKPRVVSKKALPDEGKQISRIEVPKEVVEKKAKRIKKEEKPSANVGSPVVKDAVSPVAVIIKKVVQIEAARDKKSDEAVTPTVIKKSRPTTAAETDTAARPAYVDRPAPEMPASSSSCPCASCGAVVDLRKCQVYQCRRVFSASLEWKICSDCLFERGGLSFEDFGQRRRAEETCPHCQNSWVAEFRSA